MNAFAVSLLLALNMIFELTQVNPSFSPMFIGLINWLADTDDAFNNHLYTKVEIPIETNVFK